MDDYYSPTVNTYDYPTSAGMDWGAYWLVILGLWVVSIIALWRVFEKAGKPGWASIIPIYNAYVLLQIAGRPGWWLLLMLVPVVNLVISIILALDIAKAFGKSSTFGIVGLWLFGVIGYMILGFGNAKYVGPKRTV